MREEEQSGRRSGERAEKPLLQETLSWQQGAGLTWKAAACWPCLQQPSEPLARMLPGSCRRQSKYSQQTAWSLKGGKKIPVAAQPLLRLQSNLNFTIPPPLLFLTLELVPQGEWASQWERHWPDTVGSAPQGWQGWNHGGFWVPLGGHTGSGYDM